MICNAAPNGRVAALEREINAVSTMSGWDTARVLAVGPWLPRCSSNANACASHEARFRVVLRGERRRR